MFDKKKLKQAFESGLIDEQKYKDELFKVATEIKERKPKRIYDGLKPDEFKKLYDSYTIENQKIILLLAYNAGMRLKEILNLEKDDFDFESKTIKVRKGKFSKDRVTILPKYFKESYLTSIPFVNKKNKKLSKMAVQTMFLKRSMKVGINKIIDTYKLESGKTRNIYKYHFHCLRHSFALNLLKQGIPLNHVQKLLGHSNIAATSVYTEANAIDVINFAISKGI